MREAANLSQDFLFSNLGSSGKFDLKNTVINIVAGLGLLSFITMFCDFVLLHYVKERKIVSQSALPNQQPITLQQKYFDFKMMIL